MPNDSPTSAFRSTIISRRIHQQPCNSCHALDVTVGGNSQFFEGLVTAQPLPLRWALACDLRQGAVNAGGSQVGIPGRGAFGRPDRFSRPQRLPDTPTPASIRAWV